MGLLGQVSRAFRQTGSFTNAIAAGRESAAIAAQSSVQEARIEPISKRDTEQKRFDGLPLETAVRYLMIAVKSDDPRSLMLDIGNCLSLF